MYRLKSTLIFLIFLPLILTGKNILTPESPAKLTISGYVRDKASGEMLAGVTVFENNLKSGTSTNAYGYYSIVIPSGNYDLQFSYIGYNTVKKEGVIEQNLTIDISLEFIENQLGEVVVQGERKDQNIRSTEMSIVRIDSKTINRIPALFGEIDLVKVIQLLPGVQPTSEGSSGFSVRGGSSDQNLILLDEATIYNASHLLGFFSVFNNDAVKDVTLYKGDIPAAYGGRLSSLIDVRMKDGNSKTFTTTGSLGTISSKLTLEGPIKKDRTTFLLAGRRTYADLFLPLAKNESLHNNKLYFYDLNLKLSHVIDKNNRLFLSGYSGRDIFKNQFGSIGFGNQTASLRWNHLFSNKLFFNLSLIYSRYSYEIGTPPDDANAFTWKSKLRDYSARFDFTHYLSDKHTLKFGATTMFHEIIPGTAYGSGTGSAFTSFVLPDEYALEHSLYISDEYKMYENLTFKYGLRIALFQNIGPGTYYNYDEKYNPVDSTVYASGNIFNAYSSFEPRIAFNYLINEKSSVKGSYLHTSQFITLAQNSTAGTPLDIWFPATPNVRPQLCDQFSIGYFRNFINNKYEVSTEIYYKDLKNVIDFRDHAQLLLNQYLEGEIRVGRGYSYGLEALIRKNEGRLTGWISYTWSRSFRIVPEINYGDRYNAPYDKPHSVNIVTSYSFSKRISASATWVYATGLPVTFPTGRAVIGNAIVPIYSNRNAYRMTDYHRLDLSVSIRGKEKPGKKWHGEWNISVYNAYNRHNSWAINFVQDTNDPNVTYAEKTYLFAIIPALTYNFIF
jgi:hypothetical protein